MIATKAYKLFLASIILVLCFSPVGAEYSRARLHVRAEGGEIEVNGQTLDVGDSALRLAATKRDDLCYFNLNFVSKGETSENKVFFKLRLNARDGCDFSGEQIFMGGDAYLSYRSIPRVIRRPLVNDFGRIYWLREVLGNSERISELVPIEIISDGERIWIQSTMTDFFSVNGMEITRIDYKEY